jgi:hypothetical protein
MDDDYVFATRRQDCSWRRLQGCCGIAQPKFHPPRANVATSKWTDQHSGLRIPGTTSTLPQTPHCTVDEGVHEDCRRAIGKGSRGVWPRNSQHCVPGAARPAAPDSTCPFRPSACGWVSHASGHVIRPRRRPSFRRGYKRAPPTQTTSEGSSAPPPSSLPGPSRRLLAACALPTSGHISSTIYDGLLSRARTRQLWVLTDRSIHPRRGDMLTRMVMDIIITTMTIRTSPVRTRTTWVLGSHG